MRMNKARSLISFQTIKEKLFCSYFHLVLIYPCEGEFFKPFLDNRETFLLQMIF